MREISGSEYDEVIKTGVVVVEFWAPWCAPCRALAPKLEALVEKCPNVTFVKMNVDENEAKVAALGMRTIPRLHLWMTVEGERACYVLMGAESISDLHLLWPEIFSTP